MVGHNILFSVDIPLPTGNISLPLLLFYAFLIFYSLRLTFDLWGGVNNIVRFALLTSNIGLVTMLFGSLIDQTGFLLGGFVTLLAGVLLLLVLLLTRRLKRKEGQDGR